MNLSDEPFDMLLNAEAHVGGCLGVANPRTEVASRAELADAGLIGRKGCLTRKGAAYAIKIQKEHWES